MKAEHAVVLSGFKIIDRYAATCLHILYAWNKRRFQEKERTQIKRIAFYISKENSSTITCDLTLSENIW